MKRLPMFLIAAGAAIGLAGSSQAGPASGLIAADSAGPPAQLVVGVYNASQPATLEKTQFFWGGRNFCWYFNGWQGPGYYWCGYAWRRGYGWAAATAGMAGAAVGVKAGPATAGGPAIVAQAMWADVRAMVVPAMRLAVPAGEAMSPCAIGSDGAAPGAGHIRREGRRPR